MKGTPYVIFADPSCPFLNVPTDSLVPTRKNGIMRRALVESLVPVCPRERIRPPALVVLLMSATTKALIYPVTIYECVADPVRYEDPLRNTPPFRFNLFEIHTGVPVAVPSLPNGLLSLHVAMFDPLENVMLFESEPSNQSIQFGIDLGSNSLLD
jgi:hypothetical protein